MPRSPGQVDSCFVCGSPTVLATNDVEQNSCGDGARNRGDPFRAGDAIEKEQRKKLVLEQSVFVLKSLFQVPDLNFLDGESASLINRNNGNVQKLEFCDSCSESVEMAKTIYDNFLEAVQIFRSIQQQLVEKIKERRCPGDEDGNQVWDKWRQFICNHTYCFSGPFLLEDCSHVLPNLLNTLETNSSSSAHPLPEPNVKEAGNGNLSALSNVPEDVKLEELNHHDSNDSVETSVQTLDDEEHEEEEIDANEVLEEDEDIELYSSEEEKAFASDEDASEDEDDLKPEVDPLEIGDEDESSISSGIGTVVSTRTLRSSKTVLIPKPTDDSQMSSIDDNSIPGSSKSGASKIKKFRDPKRRRLEYQKRRDANSTKPAPFPCPKPDCFYSYSVKASLLKHLEKDHNEKQLKHKCFICSQPFYSETQIRAHLSLEHPNSFFPCHLCSKYFKKEATLKVHTTTFHSNRPRKKYKPIRKVQKCTQAGCSKIFYNSPALKTHLNRAHNIKPVNNLTIKCTFKDCSRTFKSAGGLALHLTTCHNVPSSHKLKMYKCSEPNCEKSYRGPGSLKIHIYKDHKKEPLYKCESCEETFWTGVQLRKHRDKFHREGISFICDICTKEFSCGSDLWHHRKFIHGVNQSTSLEVISELAQAFRENKKVPNEKLFPCNVDGCPEAFGSYVALRDHLSVAHREEPKFQCKKCDLAFPKVRLLRRHEEIVHISGETESGKAFMCEECGKGFTCTDYLKLHQKKVCSKGEKVCSKGEKGCSKGTNDSGVTSEVCDLCGKTLKSKSSLYSHYRKVHKESSRGGDDPGGVCELCGKVFEKKVRLYAHYRSIHEKKYVCEQCGKRFCFQSKLRHHLYVIHKIGTEEDRFKDRRREGDCRCPLAGCRKEFWGKKAEENFKKHMEEDHGGEDGNRMPFVCEECGKGYGNKQKFEEHRLMHLNKDTKPFKCEMCGKGFATRGYLRYHQLNTHKAPRLIERKKETKPRDRIYLKKSDRKRE